MTKPKTAKKRGRPRKVITDDHIRQIEALAGYGLTEASIAHVIGISPSVFRSTKAMEARISGALSRGRARAEGLIGKSLFERAQAGDIQAIRWWEMTRANRREKIDAEHSGKDGQPIQTEHTERFVQYQMPHNPRFSPHPVNGSNGSNGAKAKQNGKRNGHP